MTRVAISKKGNAKYISHLVINRSMQRIMARAEIPIWYTQGFNPHPYMVFSAALPTGVCGERELLDIKLVDPPEYSVLLERMNGQAPDGISFLEIYDSDRDFKYIEKAVYRLEISDDNVSMFDEFISSNSIPVVKKTKSGEISIDLKEEMQIKKTGEIDGYTVYEIISPCGNDRNISPALLTAAYADETGQKNAASLTRTAFLDNRSVVFR